MEIREENGNIILTGVTEKSEVGTSDLIDREFNSSKNINGEYIGVVVLKFSCRRRNYSKTRTTMSYRFSILE